jgi:hypothetical protein
MELVKEQSKADESNITITYTNTADGQSTNVQPITGTYDVVVEIAGTTNYKTARIAKQITFEKAGANEIVFTMTSGWTYDGQARYPTVKSVKYGDEKAVKFEYRAEGDDKYTSESPKDAGIYYVRAVTEETDYYGAGVTEDRKFVITKAANTITITIKDNQVVVTTTNGTPKVEYKRDGTDDSNYQPNAPTTAGKYVVHAYCNESQNYEYGEATLSFEISDDGDVDETKPGSSDSSGDSSGSSDNSSDNSGSSDNSSDNSGSSDNSSDNSGSSDK